MQIAKVKDARRNRLIYYSSFKTIAQPLKGPAITELGLISVKP